MPFILAAAAVFGQAPPSTPEKAPPQAPPEADAALRARITQFYQLQIDGKFYQALQLVSDDTKDSFVGAGKPITHSFQIQSVKYSEDFTKAEVAVLVDYLLPMEGFMGQPFRAKTPSRWKLENGLWCYYVDPEKDFARTPFGPMRPRAKPLPAGGSPGAPRPLPPMPANLANPGTVTSLLPLAADKPNVELKASGPSAAQVTISNTLPFPAILALTDPKVAGLTAKLDPLVVKTGERATLSIQWSAGAAVPKAPVTIAVTVQQTRQSIPIKVSFAN